MKKSVSKKKTRSGFGDFEEMLLFCMKDEHTKKLRELKRFFIKKLKLVYPEKKDLVSFLSENCKIDMSLELLIDLHLELKENLDPSQPFGDASIKEKKGFPYVGFEIRINPVCVLPGFDESEFNATVGHELAHLFDFLCNGKKGWGHGKTWKEIMSRLELPITHLDEAQALNESLVPLWPG